MVIETKMENRQSRWKKIVPAKSNSAFWVLSLNSIFAPKIHVFTKFLCVSEKCGIRQFCRARALLQNALLRFCREQGDRNKFSGHQVPPKKGRIFTKDFKNLLNRLLASIFHAFDAVLNYFEIAFFNQIWLDFWKILVYFLK